MTTKVVINILILKLYGIYPLCPLNTMGKLIDRLYSYRLIKKLKFDVSKLNLHKKKYSQYHKRCYTLYKSRFY